MEPPEVQLLHALPSKAGTSNNKVEAMVTNERLKASNREM
jgi:hypothetical protein